MRERIVRPTESFRMDAYRGSLRPVGRIHIDVWRRGKLLYTLDRKNLVVNTIITPLSKLLGGDVSNQSASVIGFGSGTALPTVSDTGLTNPSYYKALDGHTYPSAGSVQFQWSIQPTDYAAVGIAVCEFGLFANTGSSLLPSAQGTSFSAWAAATPYAVGSTIKDSNNNLQVSTALPAWQASHAYSVGNIILDSNGNIQRCTTAGTSGAAHPTWATVVGNTTTDNTGGLDARRDWRDGHFGGLGTYLADHGRRDRHRSRRALDVDRARGRAITHPVLARRAQQCRHARADNDHAGHAPARHLDGNFLRRGGWLT